MDSVRSATESLLEEQPKLESDLEVLLETDAESEEWSFEDVPLDSGVFGEIVSHGLVEDAGDGYRVADPEAVRAALDMEPPVAHNAAPGEGSAFIQSDPFKGVVYQLEQQTILGLAGVLLLVALFRVVPYPHVVVDGATVLSSNDPYFYRYLVEETVARSGGVVDLQVLAELPSRARTGEPLLVATLWLFAVLASGEGAAGAVVGWYPVVAALVSATFVYLLAFRLTDDRRIAVASVVLLAVTPGHAFRTGLGFGDHHAFDYVWLALTVLALVTVYGENPRKQRTILWMGALAAGVAGQVLAWDAGPLLLVPVGLSVTAAVLLSRQSGESPAESTAEVVVSLATAAGIVYVAHAMLGWQTAVVAHTPMVLLLGVVVVVATGEAAARADVSPEVLLALQGAVGAIAFGAALAAIPTLREELDGRLGVLFDERSIAETQSVFAGELGWVVSPITLFGLLLVLAVPVLGWTTYRAYREHSPRWVVPVTYCWYLLLLAVLQRRFVGELAVVASVFAGLGFVFLAAWVGLTTAPTVFKTVSDQPSLVGASSGGGDVTGSDDLHRGLGRRELLSTAGLYAMIAGPGAMFTPVKHSSVTTDREEYRAAKWMHSYSDGRDWEYPRNYVFSEWDANRLYNYFVNGEAESYRFAQTHFIDFLQSTDGEKWYRFLNEERRSGFIVISRHLTQGDVDGTLYDELFNQWGEQTSNYRALWASENQSVKVYTPVPGAIVTGPGEPGETIDLELITGTDGRTFEVERSLTVDEFGVYAGTVPLPGTTDHGNTITVEDVTGGGVVSEFAGEGTSRWAFDEGDGTVVYDRVGGYHGTVDDAEWVTTDGGAALSFEDGAKVVIPRDAFDEEHEQLTFAVRFSTTEPHDWNGWILSNMDSTGGFRLRMNRGQVVGAIRRTGDDISPRVRSPSGLADGEWHHATVVFDGEHGRVALYLDGEEADTVEWDGNVATGNRLEVGASDYYGPHFEGRIDDVRIWDEALTSTEVAEYYEQFSRS